MAEFMICAGREPTAPERDALAAAGAEYFGEVRDHPTGELEHVVYILQAEDGDTATEAVGAALGDGFPFTVSQLTR